MSAADLLSDHVREEIDHWKARFPEGRQRSAVISARHAAQHEKDGDLTPERMDAVAEYLDLPTIQVYEVATFYSMFQTKPDRSAAFYRVALYPDADYILTSDSVRSRYEKNRSAFAGCSLPVFGVTDICRNGGRWSPHRKPPYARTNRL